MVLPLGHTTVALDAAFGLRRVSGEKQANNRPRSEEKYMPAPAPFDFCD
jgi:hypothetical protein